MIVDTSAIVAVLKREQGYEAILELLLKREARIPAPVLVETRVVVSNALGVAGRRRLESLLDQCAVEVIDFTEQHAAVAAEAYRDFGKGTGHPARLSLGDTFGYAVASVGDEPLLFVGDDFTHTDIEPALS